MSKLMQQLNALRDSMRDADGADSDSFSEVFSTFLELAESTELMSASDPLDDEAVHFLLENVGRQYTKKPALKISHLQMLQHPKSGIVHGVFFAGGHPGTFFYFPQEQQGIVAFAESMSMMHYYRMTATLIPAGDDGDPKRWSN